MSIAEKLTYLKRKTGLSTADVAQLSGVPLGTVNKIASGQTSNPSSQALDRISRIFRVPMRYLVDDSVPPRCHLGAYAAAIGDFLVSEQEWRILQQYRTLTPQSQTLVEEHLRALSRRYPPEESSDHQRTLLCYLPFALEESPPFHLYRISATLDQQTAKAELAIQLIDDALFPLYPAGTVLAFCRRPARDGEFGVFLSGRRVYVRKYLTLKDGGRLVPLHNAYPGRSSQGEDLQCLGTVLGPIRKFHQF